MAKRRAEGELTPVLRVCDAVGGLMEFWGFSRHMGRVWTLLYLAPKPLATPEIQLELSISAGAVSAVIRELLRWGVVRKLWVPGERKDYYEAETDLWKMVSRVFEEREKKLLDETRTTLDRAAEELATEARRRSGEGRTLATFQRDRVEELRRLCGAAEMMLRMLVQTQRVDASSIARDLGR